MSPARFSSRFTQRGAVVTGWTLLATLCSVAPAIADTVRGQVTKCDLPVTGIKVQAFVNVQEGFRGGFKPCTVTTSTVAVGEEAVDAAGRFSITFSRPQRDADEDVCSFALKGAFVELRDATSGALVWRSGVKVFSGASTTFIFDHALECPPPPPPPGPQSTLTGHITLCGEDLVGYEVAAVTEVKVGFDASDLGGKPCQIGPPKYTQAGTTTIGSDGKFRMTIERPTNEFPEDTCLFSAKVFIKVINPSTGRLVWVSPSKGVGQLVTFDADVCQAFVAVSVKVVLDGQGKRPAGGDFSTDAQIERAISEANTVLSNNDVGWRLFLTEIADVLQPQYVDIDSERRVRELELDAKQDPAGFLWRDDAINIYVVDELKDEGSPLGGLCSFPHSDEIIVISNRGILNGGVGWMHEIGHYFSLTHTFECFAAGCDQSACTGAGASHSGRHVSCPDNCPHDENVMSYNSFAVSDAVFSACQIREMAFELFDAEGTRSHVIRRQLPSGAALPRILLDLASFRRGDSNGDARVDMSDALNTLNVLLVGNGSIGCADAADANDDGRLDISDAVASLGYLFLGKDLIAAPGPLACSPDTSADALPDCQYNEATCPVTVRNS